MGLLSLLVGSIGLHSSDTCEIDFLLSFDRLLLSDRLGRRMVPAKVSDLFGTSILPVAVYVWDGVSSGSSTILVK